MYYKDDSTAITNDQLSYIAVNYLSKSIVIKTPPMTMPFSINNNTGSFIMNLQFTNYQEDESMNGFYDFIRKIEQNQINHIGLDKDTIDQYTTQIRRDKYR